jgi:hypothetical protein
MLLVFIGQGWAEVARATSLSWIVPAGGSAGTSTNWFPFQVPTPADDLSFALPDTYIVTYPSSVDSSRYHFYWDGDVSIGCDAPHGIAIAMHVAPTNGTVATVRLTDGTLRAAPLTSVGSALGAIGTLRVNGAGTNLQQNPGASSSVIDIGSYGGTGSLIVRNGGLVDAADRLNLGLDDGLGTLSIRGDGVFNSKRRRSAVTLDGAEGTCQAGGIGGHGVIEVLDSGLLRVAKDLLLSLGATDTTDVTIAGDGPIDSARIRVKDDLWVAANSTVGAPGGVAQMTVDSLGVLVVEDSTLVGDPDGSSGQIALLPGSRMITKHLILRQPSGSPMDLHGGLLQVNGGSLSTYSNRLVVPGASAIGVTAQIEMLNGATASLVGGGSSPLRLGTAGKAILRIVSGSSLTANGGDPAIGETDAYSSTLHVSDEGQFHSDGRARIGTSGIGTMEIETGGIATVNGLDLGCEAWGVGILNLDDSGSRLDCAGTFNVGGTAAAQVGSVGVVDLRSHAVLNCTAPILAGNVWSNGNIIVAGGAEMNLTGALVVRGDVGLSDGTIAGGALVLRDNARVSGSGAYSTSIVDATDTTVTITPDGDLLLGRDAPAAGVLIRGQLSVPPGIVTIVDPDSAILGNVTMQGGTLQSPAGGGVIEPGKRLRGDGTIRGPVLARGYVLPGTGTGLRFEGTLYGTGQGCNGGLISFAPGGAFEGGGGMLCSVTADSGSLIRATDSLTIGTPSIVTALALRGRIEANGHRVKFQCATGPQIRGVLDVDGGSVSTFPPAPVTILAGGRIEGSGRTDAPLVIIGTAAPGHSAGRLDAASGVSWSGGTYEAELGSHAGGQWDTLAVHGSLALSGTLALKRMASYSAAAGDSFPILSCDSLSGTFASVTLDGAPLAGQYFIHYSKSGVVVVAAQTTVGVPIDAPVASSEIRLAPLGSPGPHPALELSLPSTADVQLRLYDLQGREVARLADGPLPAGRHRYDVARELSAVGLYFVRAVVTDRAQTVVRARLVRTK